VIKPMKIASDPKMRHRWLETGTIFFIETPLSLAGQGIRILDGDQAGGMGTV
jgi:hypothetical protein